MIKLKVLSKGLISICLLFPLIASDKIIINTITTNDIHGVIGEQMANFMNPQYPPKILGGSAMLNYVNNLRDNIDELDEGLLLLDGGNFFQGHPLGLLDNGVSMINWMNILKYDAVVPGRYDFILGSENINNLFDISNANFLGANIKCNNCALESINFKPYIIKEIKGVKVGILGIVNSSLKDWVLAENINFFRHFRSL